ncbi:MAG: hypothetical protein ACOC3Z_00575 [Nanoarchaeota archaeon]
METKNKINGILGGFNSKSLSIKIKNSNGTISEYDLRKELFETKYNLIQERLQECVGQYVIVNLDKNNDYLLVKLNEEETAKKMIDVKPKNSFNGVKIETKQVTKKESKDFETVNIKGKEYVMVNERIKYFRKNYPTYSIVSEIVELNEKQATFKSSILNESGQVLATGHAQEKADSSFINKTSYIENAETSSWGRALANMGIGIDVSMASADEVANAINNQK